MLEFGGGAQKELAMVEIRWLSQMAEKKVDIFVESHCQKDGVETMNKQRWNGK